VCVCVCVYMYISLISQKKTTAASPKATKEKAEHMQI